jgi:hypothetical protein
MAYYLLKIKFYLNDSIKLSHETNINTIMNKLKRKEVKENLNCNKYKIENKNTNYNTILVKLKHKN